MRGQFPQEAASCAGHFPREDASSALPFARAHRFSARAFCSQSLPSTKRETMKDTT